MNARSNKKMTRQQLAEALAKAMNLLNDVAREDWSNRQLGDWHELAYLMPESVDYMNNGTVMPNDL